MLEVVNRFEEWFHKQSTQNILVYVGFAVAFILIFALNYYFPIYADDMMYSVVKHGESADFGQSMERIVDFLNMYYLEWGGRIVAHGVDSILLLFNFTIQDLFNSITYVILLCLIYKISNQTNKNNIFVLVFIVLSVFYFTPSFLSSAVWITGSANYLWMSVFALFFLYPYVKYSFIKEAKFVSWQLIGFFVLGMLAGCTNENLGPVVCLLASVYCIYYYNRDKCVPRWAIAGLVGAVVGCCIMILAPGNALRAEAEGYPGLFSSIADIPNKISRLWPYYKYFMSRLIILFVVFNILFYYFNNTPNRKIVLLNSWLFFIIANTSIFITILAPTFPPRAFFSITVLTVVSVCILYANIDIRNKILKIVNLIFLTIFLFFSAIDYVKAFRALELLDGAMKKRVEKIDDARARGINSITFEAIHLDYRYEYMDFVNYYKDYYNMDVLFLEKDDPRLDKNSDDK